MSKERLKDIRENTKFPEWEIGKIKALIETDDYDWLVEQAERVQELENKYKLSEGDLYDLTDRHKRVKQQNKRYREAIEKAKSESAHRIGDSTINKMYTILDEVLEGEE